MFMPNKKPKFEQVSQEDETFEQTFLNDFPRFTAHRGDVRALSAFRREFKLHNYKDLNVFVLAHEGDVSADRVFAEDKENNVVFYSTSKGVKRALESRGHEAKKSNLERRTENEQADVFIVLDSDVRVTRSLLKNVAPGGWVLCRLATANSLRARGNYSFKAVVEKSGENASIERRDDPRFWKSVEVDSDKSFREASNLKSENVVTYEEARQKVLEAREAGVPNMSENDVFESYSRLITMAEEQNPAPLARGETVLPCVATVKEEQIDLGDINTALPTKKAENEDENTIIVMKKNEFV